MKLATLKTKLITITGTSIGEVIFDYQKELNVIRSKTYPIVFWSFDSTDFTNDIRTSNIQYDKEYTITAFIIGLFNKNSDDRITVWDTLEGYFNTYLNAIDKMSTLQVINISELKGKYMPEGTIAADNIIGIEYEGIVIKTFCST